MFVSEELALRLALFHPDHPDTLFTRCNVAARTGEVGGAGKALALFEELLLDQVWVLGPDHPDTRRTKALIEALRRDAPDSR